MPLGDVLSGAEASPTAYVSRNSCQLFLVTDAFMSIHGLMFPLLIADDLQKHREEAALQ